MAISLNSSLRGFVKVQSGDAAVAACKASEWQEVLKKLWDTKLGYENQMLRTPDVFLCIGGKVLDFSNTVGFEQLITIMKSEFMEAEEDEDIILICSKTEIL